MPDPPKRTRLPSRPELTGILTPDQPERGTVKHSAVDGAPQELPPHRKATLHGLGAGRLPGPPPLPLEQARTVPAAAHAAPTQRIASPINVQAVRIENAPEPVLAPSLPPPSQDPRDAQIAALRARAEAAEAKAKHSAPPDRGAWAKLGYRIAAAAAGAAVLVIAALGARAVSMVESKADAAKAAQRKTSQDVDARDVEWQTWARRVVAVEECRQEQQGSVLERLLPPKGKLVSSTPLSPWTDECPALPKPP